MGRVETVEEHPDSTNGLCPDPMLDSALVRQWGGWSILGWYCTGRIWYWAVY